MHASTKHVRSRPRNRPGADRTGRARPRLPPFLRWLRPRVGPVRRPRGSVDPRELYVRERAGRLRHARRPREPARPELAPDRTADHAGPGARRPPRRSDLPAPGRPRHHEHGLPRRERASPLATTSCSSATAAIDGSSRLDCPEVVSAREHSRDLLSDATFASVAAGFRACADRLRADGVDLAGYSIPERVDDLELARRELGYRQIDLVSESAGTRTAMIYAWRYPKSIHRSVMIAVNPPGHFVWDAKTTGEQIRRYAALCAADAGCRSRTPDLTASLHSGVRATSRITGGSCRSSRATSRRPASSG